MNSPPIDQPQTAALLIDKPKHCTSNKILQIVKKTLGFKKAGHTGTLDPLATGLMILCFERSTRLIEYILEQDKQYEFHLALGTKTDTADAEGSVIEQQPVPTTLEINAINAKCAPLMGRIEQIPPMYSALKHQGQPLYKLARQNIVIPREPRAINIHSLECLEITTPTRLKFKVHGSKGLYVRTLGESIAQLLGTCGHIAELRRTHIGHHHIKNACKIPLEKEAIDPSKVFTKLQPIDSLMPQMPTVHLSKKLFQRLSVGKHTHIHTSWPPNNTLFKYYHQSKFAGIAIIENTCVLKAKKNILPHKAETTKTRK